jgi:AcrR family transcriptional regulator
MSEHLRRDAAANRDRVVAAAVDVFNDEGTDAGVERIAKRAGVGVGTLYRRFGTKEALIAYLVDEMLADMTRAAAEALDEPDGRGLERFLRVAAEQLAAHRGCLQRLWKRQPSSQAGLTTLRRHIDRLVSDAKAAGTVRADVTRTDVTTLLWSVQGVIDNAGSHARTRSLWLIDVAVAGLRPAS